MKGLLDGMPRADHNGVRLKVRSEFSRAHDKGEGQSLDFRVSSLGVEERLANVIDRSLHLVFFAYENRAHGPVENREVDVQGFAILWLHEERGGEVK